MEVQTDEFYILHFQSHIDHPVHVLHTDTEFVFSQTGGDIGVRMRPDIRIDTESDISDLILSGSQFVDDFQFGDRLYIETEDAIFQSEVDLPIRFPDSSKTILLAGNPARTAARISPPLTQSAPIPLSRIMVSTFGLAFAFTA